MKNTIFSFHLTDSHKMYYVPFCINSFSASTSYKLFQIYSQILHVVLFETNKTQSGKFFRFSPHTLLPFMYPLVYIKKVQTGFQGKPDYFLRINKFSQSTAKVDALESSSVLEPTFSIYKLFLN